MVRTTPENITELKENEVFVFGSNEAGIHGAGAAFLACNKFGAERGYGFGFSRNEKTYAIPTKDMMIQTLPLDEIERYVSLFAFSAKERTDLIFLVTQIGCGLAGFTPKEIAPLFKNCVDLENVYLPQSFLGGSAMKKWRLKKLDTWLTNSEAESLYEEAIRSVGVTFTCGCRFPAVAYDEIGKRYLNFSQWIDYHGVKII